VGSSLRRPTLAIVKGLVEIILTFLS